MSCLTLLVSNFLECNNTLYFQTSIFCYDDVRDCPNDINEAVSSLIFASARFGDLPELLTVRKLFGERYGQRFTNVAVKLLPGNLVNRQVWFWNMNIPNVFFL